MEAAPEVAALPWTHSVFLALILAIIYLVPRMITGTAGRSPLVPLYVGHVRYQDNSVSTLDVLRRMLTEKPLRAARPLPREGGDSSES